MAKTNLCLIVLTLTPLLIGTEKNVRQKRQILPDQPRIITENGHLIFQSGVNHNITFRSGSGGVFVDNLDLKNAVSQVHTNKAAIVTLHDALNSGNVPSRVASLENQLMEYSRVVQDVHDLSVAVNTARTQAEETTRLLNSRLTHIEEQTRNGNIMTDIPTQVSRLQDKVQALENLVETLVGNFGSLQTLLTTNECLSNPCLNGGTCVDMYNGFLCRCPPNWQGPHCTVDVDECADYAGTDMSCQHGATCMNSQGGFSCQCTTNWYGIHCSEQHNDCMNASQVELCDHGTCVNEESSEPGQPKYRCICETGWTKSSTGPACTVDVDECATGIHCSVDPPVQCLNFPGYFVCGFCPLGYTGNGHNCYDINECAVDNGGCSTSPRVQCTNTQGSRACGACPAGYQGDGVSCSYVGLCSQNNGGCHHLATCSETSGLGVICSCPDGYVGDGNGPNGCQDQSHAAACASNPCHNGAVCTPVGSAMFSCACHQGFSGATCSVVVDACLSNPCQNSGECISQTQAPGYSCECTSDFTGTNCQEAQQECGGNLIGEAGSFRYPRTAEVLIPDDINCYWTVSTRIDKVLTVTFPIFNLEEDADCSFDFLQIHDGSSQSSNMIGRYCGTHPPNGGSLNSTNNQLYFWFRSDNGITSEGFEVHWTSHSPICGSHLNVSDHGFIKSPGYPGNYPHDQDCVWTVLVSPGSNILFTFAHLELEAHPDCDSDYLEIRDGEFDTSPLIGRFCNSQTPTPIQTTGPYAYVRFHSDHSNSGGGFHIIYTALTVGRQGCGAALSGPEGEVMSPGYPNPYSHDRTCVWVITVSPGSSVQLSFIDFDLETSSSCSQDYLKVKDGSDQMAATLGTFCGTDQPAVITSSSNIIGLELHTDEQNSGRGFKAHWTTGCGGTFSALQGQIHSPNWPGHYPLTKVCNYLIEVPDSHTVSFQLTDNGLGEGLDCTYNYIEFHDGATLAATVINSRLCGSDFPSIIMSTGSNLLVSFVTDGSVNNHGFRGTFTAVRMGPEGCGGVYNNNAGIISSPGHPNQYPHGVNCTWYINVSPGLIIRLIFHTFSFENPYGNKCVFDFVDIYDNSTIFEESLLGRYCGSNLPTIGTSTDNTLVVYMQTDDSLAFEGFTASYVAMNMSTICGSALTSASGVITSPNYPNPFRHNRLCDWTITVDNGNQILLNITDMDFSHLQDCYHEFLEIRNGGNSSSPQMNKFCGKLETSQTYLSHGHLLFLRYRSTSLNRGRGFRLEYSSAAAVCGADFTTPTGVIMSPNYPNGYSHTAPCYWSITVSQGSSITLMFEDFDLQHHANCLVVQERDSFGAYLGSFCGSTLPSPVMSKSNRMWLKFRSDGLTSGKGFKLYYHIDCNKRLTGTSGVIESINFPKPYPLMTNCVWIIEVPVGNKINVTFAAFRLEHDATHCWDYLQINDGDDVHSRTLATLCGTNFPDPLQSTGNLLRLHFFSDFIINHDGFRLEWAVDGCGGHLFGSTGTITSPNYPNRPTQSSIECHWTITVDTGKAIKLTISTFDLDNHSGCESVFLKIYAGSYTNGPQLTKLCHKLTQPEILHTTGTTALIQFKYSEPSIGTGFKLTYSAVSGGCGGNFTARTATIRSFNYPQNYEYNTECEWNITVAPGHVVALTFAQFYFGRNICDQNFVKLYDGPSEDAAVIAVLCGWLPGGTKYISSRNHMFIRMQTNETHQWFVATYTTGCGGTLNADTDGEIFSPGYPGRYPWNTLCVWIISSSFHDRRVSLTFTHMDLPSGDGCTTEFVSVNYGLEPALNETGTPQNHYCGTSVPSTIVSGDSALNVIFHSGNGSFGYGFRAVYSSNFAACGGDFTAQSGRFTSPNYPDGYPVDTQCVWNIKSSPGNQIQISFPHFELDPLGGINDDYVEIRSPNVSGAIAGRWFRHNAPVNLTSLYGAWVKFRSNEHVTAPGFLAEYSTSYGGNLNGDSGQIASPQYPQLYPANSNYRWTVLVSEGMRIRVTFSAFSMEGENRGVCQYDYVVIYDGTEEGGVSLGIFCGSSLPDPLYSGSNQITMIFRSDRSYQLKGFLMNWQAVTNTEVVGASVAPTIPGCGGQLRATNILQNITSPGYPDTYPNDMDCSWTVSVPEGNTVVVNITYLYLEPDSDCLSDYLRLLDGDTTDAAVINTSCHVIPGMGVIRSRANILAIVFHTDSVNTGPGFVLTYAIGCGGFMQSPTGVIKSTGYPSNYPANQNCTWEVQVLPGKTIRLDFEEQFNVADSGECDHDYLLLLNGFSSQSPPLFLNGSTNTNGRYCGSSRPLRMETSSNFLFANFISDESNQEIGFSLTYSTVSLACGGEIRLTEMVNSEYFTSPNYPDNYPHNVDCMWTMIAPANKRIQVDFEGNFSIQANTSCSQDYIEFHDGGTTNAPRIGRPLCGTDLPGTVFSTGNVMLARFRTDSSATHAGFKAKYSIATCGGRITATNGVIKSPNYPGRYGNNLDCEWTIAGPVGHFLRINITDLRLQSSPNCTADFLEIRDGNATGRIMFKDCLRGSELLHLLDSSDRVAFIRFRSDGFGTDFGFRLKYHISVEECGGELNTPTGVITSPNYPRQYPHTRSCTWDITVPEGRRVTLTFSDLRLQEAASHLTYGCEWDFVEVINGYFIESPSLGQFCGEAVPTQPIESSGNTMRVRFVTDGSVSNVGFRASYLSDREAVCGGEITDYPGNFTSPGFDNHTYDSNVQCVWRFYSPTVNSTIRLLFTSMNLQHHPSCIYDFVEIREGEDINAPLVQKYCKAYPPYGDILIPGNHAWVRFKTDASVSHRGFRLEYDVKECGGYLTDPQGVITSPNYPSNLTEAKFGCSWIITAPEGSRIKVLLTDFYEEIGYRRHLQILNGGLPDSPDVTTVNSVNLSAAILLQSNKIRIVLLPFRYRRPLRFRMEYSSETEGCGGLFHINQGSLSSPNHPSSYPHNTQCRWDITVENGHRVSLHFNPPFDLEAGNCTKDYVEVFDEPSLGTLVSLGRWCQNSEPPDMRSSSTKMVIVFQSDATTNGIGFSARWDVACGVELTQRYGVIRSPGFPNLYANNLSCDYTISLGAGTYILLYFAQFELEGGHGCQHDYINVLGGNVSLGITRNHTHLGTFCGTNEPTFMYALAQMTIQFRTDGSGQFKGFLLYYFAEECNHMYSAHAGYIHSLSSSSGYFDNMNCSWNITVSPDRIIKLRFHSFDVEVSPLCQDDHLTIYDGPDTNSHMIGRYCGNLQNIQDVIISTGNQMYITFITNHAGTSTGFFASYRSTIDPIHGCGGVLRQSYGTITSVDVDGDGLYENDIECDWLIYVNETKQVTLTVTDLHLQNASHSYCPDYLAIYDSSTEAVELANLCGSSIPNHKILASSNNVRVVFHTDWRENYAGFNLTFGETDVICGGAYIATSTPQTISSPNYPNATETAVSCTWFIDSGDDDQHVRIHVTDLQLQTTRGCTSEHLVIRNEPRESYTPPQFYCGNVIPHTYDSMGRKVKITYFLGTPSNRRGFQLTYEIADCNQNISLPSGRIISPKYPHEYPDNSNCTIRVTSPENTTLALYFYHFFIEDDPVCGKDVLEVKNSSSVTVARLCGNTIPSPIFMSDNVATLRFQTNAENHGSGYEITFTSSTQGQGCGGNITGLLRGVFTSPGYPNSLSEPMTCSWYITPVTGSNIVWYFYILPTPSEDCNNNYVSVYDGFHDTDRLFVRFCSGQNDYSHRQTDTPIMVRYVSTGNSSALAFRFYFDTNMQRRYP